MFEIQIRPDLHQFLGYSPGLTLRIVGGMCCVTKEEIYGTFCSNFCCKTRKTMIQTSYIMLNTFVYNVELAQPSLRFARPAIFCPFRSNSMWLYRVCLKDWRIWRVCHAFSMWSTKSCLLWAREICIYMYECDVIGIFKNVRSVCFFREMKRHDFLYALKWSLNPCFTTQCLKVSKKVSFCMSGPKSCE